MRCVGALELMLAHEVIDRLDVAEVLIHHLKFRRETRWPGWQTRMDYPQIDPDLDRGAIETRMPYQIGYHPCQINSYDEGKKH